jgi:L-2-hydroxyglutarate oxidase LhgO
VSGGARRVGVVGAGIVGLAVAARVQAVDEGADVTVLEAEDGVGRHQTAHNSGVVHAGVYYPEGSLKARLCRRGVGLLRTYCADRGLPYEACGKLIVALDAGELGRLDALEARARANGVPGLARVDRAGIARIEPHAAGVAALHSPHTAMTDFAAVARALAADVAAAGGRVLTRWPVGAISRRGGEVVVRRGLEAGDTLAFDRLVLCGGLQSDRLARLAGDTAEPRIVPFRGEYLRLRPERAGLVRGLIYPVPDPGLPFLGVHFTRRVDGTVDIGPNAVPAFSRTDYDRLAFDAADARSTLGAPGFWRLARRWWRFGAAEIAGSASVRWSVRSARPYVPALSAADVVRGPAGLRAQAVDPRGTLLDDFAISHLGPVTAVRNAPSPAATSALAIAEHVVERLEARPGPR